MKSRLTTLLTAVGLSVTLSVVAAPAAQADGLCTITNFNPRSVVVGLTPVVKTFSVATRDCSQAYWRAESDAFYVYPDGPQQVFNPWSNSESGSYDVIVSASNADWEERSRVFADGFRLQRQTVWQGGSFDASPEPARRGANIALAGRLLIADWSQDRYVPHGRRSVAVEFRTPTGEFRLVKHVGTDARGWVRTTVKANTTGVWRLRYAGNAHTSPAATIGDAVKVTG